LKKNGINVNFILKETTKAKGNQRKNKRVQGKEEKFK
jgi:hypothetical protein